MEKAVGEEREKLCLVVSQRWSLSARCCSGSWGVHGHLWVISVKPHTRSNVKPASSNKFAGNHVLASFAVKMKVSGRICNDSL